MAHQLTIRQNGSAEMAYIGATPWHQLGQQLDPNASIASWQQAAGFDWTIQDAPAQFQAPDGTYRAVPERKVLFRSDTQTPLAVVGDRYQVVQPQTMLEFFADLIHAHGYKIHTAGSLYGGRKLWALAETGKCADVTSQDTLTRFLLLATSCDGSLSTTARFTTVRVVCANTLAIAHKRSHAGVVTVRHTSLFDQQKVKIDLGIYADRFEAFMAETRSLAAKSLTSLQAENFILSLLTKSTASNASQPQEDALRKSRAFKRIIALFEGDGMGAQLNGARGTYWGLVNAVTQYIDHDIPTRAADARLDSAWFGKGDSFKSLAFTEALTA